MGRQSFLESIISKINAIVNQFAINKMTDNESFDMETTLFEMKSYGYNDLSEYAKSKLF